MLHPVFSCSKCRDKLAPVSHQDLGKTILSLCPMPNSWPQKIVGTHTCPDQFDEKSAVIDNRTMATTSDVAPTPCWLTLEANLLKQALAQQN